MAGLVPAISMMGHRALLIEIAGTSPAMTAVGDLCRILRLPREM
jgi:hypothetical protein